MFPLDGGENAIELDDNDADDTDDAKDIDLDGDGGLCGYSRAVDQTVSRKEGVELMYFFEVGVASN
jgi:hypothetical protein